MSEHLADFEERCRFLRCAYTTYTDAIKENNKYLKHPWPLDNSNSVDDSLQHLISGADTCRRWASNYNSRTHLYETMLYHLAAHADSQVNEENARTNIGLSIIAMAFLPGTFVSVSFC
jgi:Mg2+ and Co2+ transporter CorA